MPEVKTSEKKLLEYNNELSAELQTKVELFQAKVQQLEEDRTSQELAPIKLQERQQTLQKEQQGLIELERSLSHKLDTKRQELLEPILKRVNEAINAVGKEGNFSMIFDVSVGSLLFTDESHDVTSLVKAKLGL